MTENHDPLLEAVAGLPAIQPDANWEERVRARCRAKLTLRSTARRLTLVDIAAAAFLCAYLSALLREAARLGGLL